MAAFPRLRPPYRSESHTMDQKPLAGKVALITGGSLGIGRGIAIALAKAGAKIAVNYRSHAAEAEEVAGQIREAGSECLLLQADVSEQAAVEKLVADTVARFDRLDIAVSNAVYSDREPFYQADMAGFRRTIDVSMWGAFYLLRAAAQQMIAGKRGGSMVVISSPHATIPFPNAMAYNMAKAAIDHMARTAAVELAPQRIRVNIVHPGWIDTPGELKFANRAELDAAAKQLPWGRLGSAEEIARGVVFLCDPASDYISGGVLTIDGALSLSPGSRAPI
jgi:glucose 1-dehydrogenase